MEVQKEEEEQHSTFVKIVSAAFYAANSLFITVVNKAVLTSFRFPSYMCLGVGQMLTTIVVLYVAKMNNKVNFEDFHRGVFWKIFPLPLLYVANHITGLASTQKLSLPMLTVLRKFTIVMTMIMEGYILRKTFPRSLVYSVVTIVLGAVVAASSDLAFDVEGYTFVLLNDVFTATNGVYTKMKIGTEGLGKYGVLFYNALIIVVPTLLASAFTGDLHKAVTFEAWAEASFVICFLLSCIMGGVSVLGHSISITFSFLSKALGGVSGLAKPQGLSLDSVMITSGAGGIEPLAFMLMYSIVLCSHYNSALTTTVVGAVKNVGVALIGIFVGGDYLFSWNNFLGLSICLSGGLAYSYLTFSTTTSRRTTETSQELNTGFAEDPPFKATAH